MNGDQLKKRSARQRIPVLAENRTARAQITRVRSSIGRPPRTRAHRRRGSRDDPSRPSRGGDQHEQTVVGNLHLSRVREELPSGDLCSGSRCPDQGGRNAAPRGTRSSRRGGCPRAANASRVAEIEALSWSELKFIFAISYAQAIRRSSTKAKVHWIGARAGGARGARDRGTRTRRSRLKNCQPGSGRSRLRWGHGRDADNAHQPPVNDVVLLLRAQSGSSFGSNTTQWDSLSMDSSTRGRVRHKLDVLLTPESAVTRALPRPNAVHDRRKRRRPKSRRDPRSSLTRLQKAFAHRGFRETSDHACRRSAPPGDAPAEVPSPLTTASMPGWTPIEDEPGADPDEEPGEEVVQEDSKTQADKDPADEGGPAVGVTSSWVSSRSHCVHRTHLVGHRRRKTFSTIVPTIETRSISPIGTNTVTLSDFHNSIPGTRSTPSLARPSAPSPTIARTTALRSRTFPAGLHETRLPGSRCLEPTGRPR